MDSPVTARNSASSAAAAAPRRRCTAAARRSPRAAARRAAPAASGTSTGTPATVLTRCSTITSASASGVQPLGQHHRRPRPADLQEPGRQPVDVEQRQRQQHPVHRGDRGRAQRGGLLPVGQHRAVRELHPARAPGAARRVDQQRQSLAAPGPRRAARSGPARVEIRRTEQRRARPAAARRPRRRPRAPRPAPPVGSRRTRAPARATPRPGPQGTAIAPARSAPSRATQKAAPLRQPDGHPVTGPTPCARSRAASAAPAASSCAQVSVTALVTSTTAG